ncbi:hypothetical protein J4471_03215 [Candidatus Woesearchaeota archaeon]|nr:hypothetical protein [Candidatus Woesearchaeota archaeon]
MKGLILFIFVTSILLINGCQQALDQQDNLPQKETTPESLENDLNSVNEEISDEDIEDIDVIIDEDTL